MSKSCAPNPEVPLDLNDLRQVNVDDKNKYCRILQLFVATSPEMIHEIQAACEARALDTLAEKAHKFKCSASNISAYELAYICQSLEDASDTEWPEINELITRLNELFVQISGFVKNYCSPE